jgi:hypothetical protein
LVQHRSPAGPARLPLPFIFAPVADRWGPAVRPFPNLQPGSAAPPPFRVAGRYRLPPPRPAPSNLAFKPAMKPSLHSPYSIDGYHPS